MRFCAFLEDLRGILRIFGSSSWDFVHCCEKLPNMHKIPGGTSKYAQNPTRIFQKCTKSHEELPKRHKIPGETSKYAQNQARIFQKCTRSHD
jgi:hypothetical protein